LGGLDASQPRYPFTRPEKWINFVYKSDDFPLMTMTEDEGLTCEPLTFLPIVPMALINGCLGVGTGHSTFIPNCSPLEVTRWLLHKLGAVPQKVDVLPWYRGFQGDINVRTDIVPDDELTTISEENYADTEESQQPGEVCEERIPLSIPSTEKSLCMITTGKFKINQKGVAVVTELPIGVWTNKYTNFLDGMRNEKQVHHYRNLSSDAKPLFEIQLNKKPTLKSLKLVRTYGLTNMVLLDQNNVPHKYKTLDSVLEAFYTQRLPYYAKRKQYMIDQLVQQVIGLESRLKFITLVYEGKIEIYKKKKEEILKQMQMYQVQEELLSQIRLSSLTEEEIGDLGYDIEELQKKKLNLESVTPEDMWIKDLQEFEKFYISVYGDELKKDASTRYRNEKIDYDDELPNL
jgi:DNA topoisomerase-2